MPLKLLIQNIPYIGTSLDTILSDAGNKLREKRLETLLKSFDEKIKSIEYSDTEIISIMKKKVNTEEFYDLFLQAAQKSALSHRTDKIERFANLLKNYLIRDLSNHDYLIEVFIDITDSLTELEISKLSELQSGQIELYFTERGKPFDIEQLKKDVSEQKIRVDDAKPNNYLYDNFFMYSFNRLERLDLINIGTSQYSGGSFSVGYQTANGGGANALLHYARNDTVTLSSFGKKYIDWIIH
ncbi:MAG: hypothetical protein LBQ88_09660 [Treponema sp.]|nr:hypothetical protein [Treponema sp.]